MKDAPKKSKLKSRLKVFFLNRHEVFFFFFFLLFENLSFLKNLRFLSYIFLNVFLIHKKMSCKAASFGNILYTLLC